MAAHNHRRSRHHRTRPQAVHYASFLRAHVGAHCWTRRYSPGDLVLQRWRNPDRMAEASQVKRSIFALPSDLLTLIAHPRVVFLFDWAACAVRTNQNHSVDLTLPEPDGHPTTLTASSERQYLRCSLVPVAKLSPAQPLSRTGRREQRLAPLDQCDQPFHLRRQHLHASKVQPPSPKPVLLFSALRERSRYRQAVADGCPACQQHRSLQASFRERPHLRYATQETPRAKPSPSH